MIQPGKPSSIDEIIHLYQKDLDTSLIIENLRLSPTERVKKLEELIQTFEDIQKARSGYQK